MFLSRVLSLHSQACHHVLDAAHSTSLEDEVKDEGVIGSNSSMGDFLMGSHDECAQMVSFAWPSACFAPLSNSQSAMA